MSTTTNGTNGEGGNNPLFPLRTALLLLAAIMIGGVFGLLTYAVAAMAAGAAIAGITAGGVTLYYGHILLGEE